MWEISCHDKIFPIVYLIGFGPIKRTKGKNVLALLSLQDCRKWSYDGNSHFYILDLNLHSSSLLVPFLFFSLMVCTCYFLLPFSTSSPLKMEMECLASFEFLHLSNTQTTWTGGAGYVPLIIFLYSLLIMFLCPVHEYLERLIDQLREANTNFCKTTFTQIFFFFWVGSGSCWGILWVENLLQADLFKDDIYSAT